MRGRGLIRNRPLLLGEDRLAPPQVFSLILPSSLCQFRYPKCWWSSQHWWTCQADGRKQKAPLCRLGALPRGGWLAWSEENPSNADRPPIHARKGNRHWRAKAKPWHWGKFTSLALFLPGMLLPKAWSRAPVCFTFSLLQLSSVPTALSRMNSRLPPLGSQHPIAGRAQTTNHMPRPDIKHPILARG